MSDPQCPFLIAVLLNLVAFVTGQVELSEECLAELQAHLDDTIDYENLLNLQQQARSLPNDEGQAVDALNDWKTACRNLEFQPVPYSLETRSNNGVKKVTEIDFAYICLPISCQTAPNLEYYEYVAAGQFEKFGQEKFLTADGSTPPSSPTPPPASPPPVVPTPPPVDNETTRSGSHPYWEEILGWALTGSSAVAAGLYGAFQRYMRRQIELENYPEGSQPMLERSANNGGDGGGGGGGIESANNVNYGAASEYGIDDDQNFDQALSDDVILEMPRIAQYQSIAGE